MPTAAAFSPAVEYARAHQLRFLNELKDLLRIPSVSTLPEHAPDVRRAAEELSLDLTGMIVRGRSAGVYLLQPPRSPAMSVVP